MKHSAKRVLSIVLCLLMMLSMLTAIVLPVSAGETPAADPYAKITGTVDGKVITPDANVYFFDPSWATKAPAAVGEQFEYTYGDGSWGNGKTYMLTWGVNTRTTIAEWSALIKSYGNNWASGNGAQDLVTVFAPGEFGDTGYSWHNAPAADPTPEQLMNVYVLGAQAGKSPVNPDKSTKENAKKIMNDRSVNPTVETVFAGLFRVTDNANLTIDGCAGTKAMSFFMLGSKKHLNLDVKNYYVSDMTNGFQTSFLWMNASSVMTVDFEDCYFNFNSVMTGQSGGEFNPLAGNKITFNDCVLAEGKLSALHPNNQTHHMQIRPIPATLAKASPNFLGEYATAPLFEFTNSAVVDWEAGFVFRPQLNNADLATYNNNAARYNITDSKFYDVGTGNFGSAIIYCDGVKTADQADSFSFNLTDNVFDFSEEIFGNRTTHSNVIQLNKHIWKVDGVDISSKYDFVIKGNIFRVVNNKYNSVFTGCDANTVAIDTSGNLFVDEDNNILPATVHNYSTNGYTYSAVTQSDIYASDSMKGGIRELMTVREVEGGSALFTFIQLHVAGNLRNYDYLTGALTLLLKRGETYDADTFIKFKDPAVEFKGVYTEEACTNKVETITQDTINGKYAKAQYKDGNTTLTVVFALNTPRNYLIVDPTGSYKANGYTFNGVTYNDGARATDGVFAKFYTNFDSGDNSTAAKAKSAYAAAASPTTNDLLRLGAQTWKDKDGQNYLYNNNLNDLILFTPGTHQFSVATQSMGKSVAIIGPQWGVSPYGESNKEGKLANNRSTDPAKEAIIKGCISPSGDASLSYFYDGLTFAGDGAAIGGGANSKLIGSMYQTIIVNNCVFANSAKTVIGGWPSANTNKVMDVTIKNCAFDATGVNRAAADSLVQLRSNLFTMENVAVINDNSGAIANGSHRLAYIMTTDGSALKWNAKRWFADFNNITIYNSNRNLVLYTLRDKNSVNANFDYYPDGVELNITNTYVAGGNGYLWGVQNGENTGAADFVKLKATNNYFNRPNMDDAVIEHWQENLDYGTGDAYSGASVVRNNVFITKSSFKANAYEGDLNIDSNFFGKVEGDKIVPTYVSVANGVEKDLTTYWMDEKLSTKTTALGLVDNGYKSIELGEFLGYNQYAIDATNITATPSIFKAANGATIEGVYTDAECTTAATAFTHPQDVYVLVKRGDMTLVNKVALNCACSHDGTTYEKVTLEPTCTVDGTKVNLCEYCDAQIGDEIPIPATGKHTPGELITDVAPTCTTTGLGHKECTVCNGTVESDILIPTVADAHVWNEEYTVDVAPTCTARGSESIHCKLCDVVKAGTAREIPMVPHNWENELVVDSEPTCQANGSKSIHCADCDTIKEGSAVVIPMGQHVWNDFYTVDVESTCTFSGLESIHCALCNTVKVGTTRDLPFSGHSWSEDYVIIKHPTCTEKGAQAYECTECYAINEESTVEIEMLEHDWQDWQTVDKEADCTTDGLASYHCYDCDATKNPVVIPAAHMDVITTYIVIPTYQEGGIEGDVCTVCGTIINQWAVDAVEGEMADTVFDDVYEDDWFFKNDAVNFVYNEGLMNGITATTFAPDATLTRGMFVTILGRLVGVDEDGNGKTAFKDVDVNAYYAPYVKWAADEGIVNGYSANEFRPNANITREQICKMILEFCNAEGITVEQTEKAIAFKDAAEISGYARKYVKACQMAGLVNGEKSGSGYIFRPQDTASRAEAATIIRNFCYAYLIK